MLVWGGWGTLLRLVNVSVHQQYNVLHCYVAENTVTMMLNYSPKLMKIDKTGVLGEPMKMIIELTES